MVTGEWNVTANDGITGGWVDGATFRYQLSVNSGRGRTYANVDTHLIYKRGTIKPQSFDQIIGRNIEITSENDHFEALQELQIDHPDLTWTMSA